MISASEARELTKNNKSNDTEVQLEQVERSIKKAVASGHKNCYYYKWLGEQSLDELRKLGYSIINRSNQREGNMYEINW